MFKNEFLVNSILFKNKIFTLLLGEPFLGFLAILASALTLAPFVFNLNSHTAVILEDLQWFIILIFTIEYIVGFFSAPSKPQFLKNPWRIVDLATVVIPLISFIPGITSMLKSAPLLRLIRIVRVLTLGLRASGLVVKSSVKPKEESEIREPVSVLCLRDDKNFLPENMTWDTFVKSLKTKNFPFSWVNIANPTTDHISELSKILNLDPYAVETHFFKAGYPHIEKTDKMVTIFFWYPQFNSKGIKRSAVSFLITENAFISLSNSNIDLIDEVSKKAKNKAAEKQPFVNRFIYYVLQIIVDRYEQIIGRFENDLRALEEIPVKESSSQFFETTFRIKKELSGIQADVWRLKELTSDLLNLFSDFSEQSSNTMQSLIDDIKDDTEFLYDTAVNIKEGILSLIELHLNVVSFEMNKVMKVLAVVSVLGLIPGVIGGILGMNLLDNPWPFKLTQVTFIIFYGMILCLYIFFVKGWIR